VTYAYTNNPVCEFTLGASSASPPQAGGQGTVGLTASAPSCAWTASSGAAWITVGSPASGTGSATVSFTVAPNPGGPRSGALTVGGKAFTINQGGKLPAPQRLKVLSYE
jgi:hypothetical protein